MKNKILIRLAYSEGLRKLSNWLYLSHDTLTEEGNQYLEWLIPKYKQWIKDHLKDVQEDLFAYNIHSDEIDIYLDSYWTFEDDFARDVYPEAKQYLAKHVPLDVQELDEVKERIVESTVFIISEIVKSLDDVKRMLLDLISNRLAQFNKITGKHYTEESLSKKLSSLVCGTIYIQLDELVEKGAKLSIQANGRPNIKRGTQRVLDQLLSKPIITDEFCHDHFNCSLEVFNKFGINTENAESNKNFILDEDWNELFTYFYDKVEQAVLDLTSDARTERNKYLLELDNDDKIGKLYGEIDYDPHNLQFRDAPIVVYRDFSDGGKDKVLIGKYGEFHIRCIKREDPSIQSKCQSKSGTFLSECYFYNPCAFIDTTNGDYSIDEVAKILSADPRIKKVYLSPGNRGGKLKRLAKKILNGRITFGKTHVIKN